MNTRKFGMNPSGRLETGAAVLAAAKAVDIELVRPRLKAFAGAHRRYAEAQREVEAADARLQEAQVRLGRCDAAQDEAVEGLARTLVSDGQPRGNPFAAFGTTPSAVKLMPAAAEARAIRQIVAAVQRQQSVSKATLAATRAAEQAAQKVEAASLLVAKLQQARDNRRGARDHLGQSWEATFAALKRGARAAADDGAPGLYSALFGPSHRSHKKMTKPAPTPTPTPATAPPATNAA